MYCQCSAIPSKLPKGFLVDIEKLLLKFLWKRKGPRNAKTTLEDFV